MAVPDTRSGEELTLTAIRAPTGAMPVDCFERPLPARIDIANPRWPYRQRYRAAGGQARRIRRGVRTLEGKDTHASTSSASTSLTAATMFERRRTGAHSRSCAPEFPRRLTWRRRQVAGRRASRNWARARPPRMAQTAVRDSSQAAKCPPLGTRLK